MKYIMNEESELWYRLQSYLVLITVMLATLGTDTGCGYGLGSTCLSLSLSLDLGEAKVVCAWSIP